MPFRMRLLKILDAYTVVYTSLMFSRLLDPRRTISELLNAASFSEIVSLWQRWKLTSGLWFQY